MRKEFLVDNWLFHKGDIKVNRPVDKGPAYAQSKTERKLIGPAAYIYFDHSNSYNSNAERRSERWENVKIPHDFIVYQDFKEEENNAHGYVKYDNGWYRKHLKLPEDIDLKDKRVTLRFDGIAGQSTIYVNGCLMCHNYSAYNSFEVDITDVIFYDKENVIAVYVNTEEFEGWWYQGGGIYRDVHLTITDEVCIDLWGVYAPAKKIDDKNWQIDFRTTVLNTTFEDKSVSLESFVIDKQGNVVAKAVGEGSVPARDKADIKYSVIVTNPDLWYCEEPNLYNIKTVLYKDGAAIGEDKTRIGFRTLKATPEGLFINGRKTYVYGVCCHQDFGLTGLAMPDNVAKFRVELLKKMGANGYRCAHYMQHANLMDAFDEMGFVVMAETRWFESTKEGIEQLESHIKRDRNRPSVVFWSTSNEEPLHIDQRGKKIHKAMRERILRLDDTRFIMAAEDKAPDQSTIYDDCDVVGINYNMHLYDKVHEMCPDKAIFASECAAAGLSRDWNFPNNAAGRTMDRDHDISSWFWAREKTIKHLKERDYVFGFYQWAGVEHRGEAMWPMVCSKSGALDLFLYEKGAFWQNKSHFTTEPMVYIVPHWNFKGLEGETVAVTVYTNCDELELFVNGESQGRKEIEPFGHGEWNVVYNPGELKVNAYRNGELVCSDSRVTTGKPQKLKLIQDTSCDNSGKDLALFTCVCLDENGNEVPNAEEYVKFYATLPAKVIATGSDNTDHNNTANNERQMYMGKIRVGVLPANGQEEIELYAMSKDLGTTKIKIKLDESKREIPFV